jgi:signal transduction histidine kinase
MRSARVVALWIVPVASFAAAALGAAFAGRLAQMLRSLPNATETSHAEPFGIDEFDEVASFVQESAQVRKLHELAMRLTQFQDLRSLLGEILSAALAAVGAGKGTIELIEKAGVQHIHTQQGFWREEGDPSEWLPELRGMSESRKLIIIEDVERSPVLGTDARRGLLRAGVRAVQCAPLVTRRGARLGHITIYGASPWRPPENELRFLELLTRQAADLIEKVREEEELRAANQALSRANQDLSYFAFAASHDLQEPLRMVTTHAQLLVKEYAAHANQVAIDYVRHIVEGTAHMRQLISDLLAFTEIRAGGDNSAEAVDLNDVIESVRLSLKTSIDDAQAVIVAEPLPTIRAHAPHFISLFQNLLSNAIKYRGEELPHIRVSSIEHGNELQLSVADNGIGIDPEYHQQIFAPFKRLHGRKIPGTGIGLAICQRAVERYGGRIWVESEAGRGSTFHFTLPTVAVHSAGERADGAEH